MNDNLMKKQLMQKTSWNCIQLMGGKV